MVRRRSGPDDPHYAPALARGATGRAGGRGSCCADLLRRAETPDIVRATAVVAAGELSDARRASGCGARRSTIRSPLVRAAAVRQRWPRRRDGRLLRDVAAAARTIRVRIGAHGGGGAAGGGGAGDWRTRSSAARSTTRSRSIARRSAAPRSRRGPPEPRRRLSRAARRLRRRDRVVPQRRSASSRTAPARARELAQLLDAVATDPRRPTPAREARRRRRGNPPAARARKSTCSARDAKLLPGDPRPHYHRGLLLYLLGRVDDAREALERGVPAGARRTTTLDGAGADLRTAAAVGGRGAGRSSGCSELQPDAEDWQGLLLRMRETVSRNEARGRGRRSAAQRVAVARAADGGQPTASRCAAEATRRSCTAGQPASEASPRPSNSTELDARDGRRQQDLFDAEPEPWELDAAELRTVASVVLATVPRGRSTTKSPRASPTPRGRSGSSSLAAACACRSAAATAPVVGYCVEAATKPVGPRRLKSIAGVVDAQRCSRRPCCGSRAGWPTTTCARGDRCWKPSPPPRVRGMAGTREVKLLRLADGVRERLARAETPLAAAAQGARSARRERAAAHRGRTRAEGGLHDGADSGAGEGRA